MVYYENDSSNVSGNMFMFIVVVFAEDSDIFVHIIVKVNMKNHNLNDNSVVDTPVAYFIMKVLA